MSNATQRYAIKSLTEARAYLQHSVLSPRLREAAKAVLQVENRSAHDIFGSLDDMKLRSCATLFAYISPPGSVFEQLLEHFFHRQPDEKTLQLLDDNRHT